MKKILITGAAGFIGSHSVEHVLSLTDWKIVALDGLTYAGNINNYIESDYYDPRRVKHVWHDLRAPLVNDDLLAGLKDIDIVWHFASDSHVDNSLEEPREFFLGNAAITANLLEWARHSDIEQFVQISTDEVYGPVSSSEEGHDEWATILPSNPYAASKAAQEAIAISYWRSYGLPLVLTNTMNNFGERQHVEKFIPKAIRKILGGQYVPIHSERHDGEWVSGSRCWLHARNHSDALLFLSDMAPYAYGSGDKIHPDRYNIAGDSATNFEIAEQIASILDRELKVKYVDAHSQRPGHDLHYGLNDSKLRGLGWQPPVKMEDALQRTVRWYKNREV